MLRWLSLQLLSWQQTTRKQKKKKKRRRSHSRLLNCPQVVPQLLLQEEEVWAEAPPTAANTWTGSSWSGAPWSWRAHLHLTGCCRSAGRKEVKGHISYKNTAGLIMAINRISCSRWPTPSLILAARSADKVIYISGASCSSRSASSADLNLLNSPFSCWAWPWCLGRACRSPVKGNGTEMSRLVCAGLTEETADRDQDSPPPRWYWTWRLFPGTWSRSRWRAGKPKRKGLHPGRRKGWSDI